MTMKRLFFLSWAKALQKKGWTSVKSIVKRKLDMLLYASEIKDLYSPPGNHLEALKGNLKGCYASE